MSIFEEEHDLFRQSFRSFLNDRIVPRIDEFEKAQIMDRTLFAEAGSHGFLGMAIPEQYGGGGVASAVALPEGSVGHRNSSTADAWIVTTRLGVRG